MIHSIQFVEGFVMDLFKDIPKKMEFTDGMNIMFSGNGSGKSVTLKFLKAYCSIGNAGGWTTPIESLKLAPEPFPHVYRAFTPAQLRAIVHWDGTPTFFNSGEITDTNVWFFQKDGDSEDGLSSASERMDTLIEHPSSGQYRLKKINKMLDIIGYPPDMNLHNVKGDVSDQIRYFNLLPRDGKRTILLDEPERSLSLPKQKQLLDIFMGVAEKHQVIMACHSPFALGLPRDKVNFIEIEPDYIAECDKLFNFE